MREGFFATFHGPRNLVTKPCGRLMDHIHVYWEGHVPNLSLRSMFKVRRVCPPLILSPKCWSASNIPKEFSRKLQHKSCQALSNASCAKQTPKFGQTNALAYCPKCEKVNKIYLYCPSLLATKILNVQASIIFMQPLEDRLGNSQQQGPHFATVQALQLDLLSALQSHVSSTHHVQLGFG